MPYHLPTVHSPRRRWGHWLGRTVAIVVLVMLAAGLLRPETPLAAVARPPHPSQAIVRDPVTQGIMDYLQAHSGAVAVPAATPAEPAQQAVMGYIRLHAAPTPTPSSLWDAAAQAARKYLDAHQR